MYIGFTDQGLALLLLMPPSSNDDSSQMVQKLAAYVGQGQQLEYYAPLIIRPSSMGVGIATRALTEYDLSSGSTTPSLSFAAFVKTQVLLQVGKGSTGTIWCMCHAVDVDRVSASG